MHQHGHQILSCFNLHAGTECKRSIVKYSVVWHSNLVKYVRYVVYMVRYWYAQDFNVTDMNFNLSTFAVRSARREG